MTNLEKAIRDAVEKGGYLDCDDFEIERSYPTTIGFSKGYKICARLGLRDMLLDLAFWQALGKARGWPEDSHCKECGGYGRAEHMPLGVCAFCNGTGDDGRLDCLNRWHRLIDHLAAGKDIESFFSSL